jgi:signal transduction histidine kinase
MSIRTRLILTHFFVILLTLTIIAVSLVFILRDYQRQIQLSRLGDAVIPLAIQARVMFLNNVSPKDVQNRLEPLAGDLGNVMIVNAKGLVLADTANGLTNRTISLNPAARAEAQRGFFWGSERLRNGRLLLFAALAAGQTAGQPVYIALDAVERPLFGTLDEIGASLLIAGGITLLVSLLVALLLARSIAGPITHLTRGTEAIARGQYDHRVKASGGDEIGRLGQSFNIMAEQVERSRRMEKDFVANVSHELKTPLTSIQGFAQAILDGAVPTMEGVHHAAQTIFDETARMTRLVGDLLTLARFESGQIPLAHEMVDLGQLLPLWVERFRPRASELGESITAVIEPLPAIQGDAGRLDQVVTNLIDNALKYNRTGGTVTVTAKETEMSPPRGAGVLWRRLGDHPSAKWVSVAVSDTGAGIPKDDLPKLFDRFYRGDKARAAGGAGLGLSIADEIVRAHGGHIEVQSEPGQGSQFTVYLPVSNGART